MIGRLTNLPMTFLGAILLGLCQELTNVSWLWPDGDAFVRIQLAIPGIFLVVAVLLVTSFRLSAGRVVGRDRSEEHTSELQSLMRTSYDVFCLTKKKIHINDITSHTQQ